MVKHFVLWFVTSVSQSETLATVQLWGLQSVLLVRDFLSNLQPVLILKQGEETEGEGTSTEFWQCGSTRWGAYLRIIEEQFWLNGEPS